MKKLPELKGKILGCWCKPNKFHGDILIKSINENCQLHIKKLKNN